MRGTGFGSRRLGRDTETHSTTQVVHRLPGKTLLDKNNSHFQGFQTYSMNLMKTLLEHFQVM